MSHYHKILGVRVNATKLEIKSAFRMLSKKHHPDLNKHPNARVQFMKIHEAYKFLNSKSRVSFKTKAKSSFNQQQYRAKKAYYKRKKIAAQEYAKKKAREAYRKDRIYIQMFLTSFRSASYPIIVLNLLLAIDFVVLPLNSKEEQIIYVSVSKKNLMNLEVKFTSETVQIDRKNITLLEGVRKAKIEKTRILGIYKGLKINRHGNLFYIHEPTGNYFLLRGVSILISFVLLLVYFYIDFEDFILSSYIIVFLMSIFELLIYLSY